MQPASGKVVVHGLRELQHDLGKIDKRLRRDLNRELRAIGKIVSDDERAWLETAPHPHHPNRRPGYGHKVAMSIMPRVRSGVVAVGSSVPTQHKRPNFGAIIMSSLYHARKTHEAEIIERFDLMLDQLAENGFGRGHL